MCACSELSESYPSSLGVNWDLSSALDAFRPTAGWLALGSWVAAVGGSVAADPVAVGNAKVVLLRCLQGIVTALHVGQEVIVSRGGRRFLGAARSED